jgi:CBS-domain-containing membrane protein
MRSVADCMTREVFAVAPDTGLDVAGRLLYAKHVSGAPVVDGRGAAVGVVTAKDLVDPDRRRGAEIGSSTVYRLTADGGRETLDGGPARAPGRVVDVMTSFVVAVPSTTPLRDAQRLMVAEDIHRLFVIDEDSHVIGIVSSMDLLRALLEP